MLLVAVGVILGPQVADIASDYGQAGTVNAVPIVTLVIVLFTDASAINSSDWKSDAAISGRLLGIGLPLTIVAGGGSWLWRC